MVNNVAVDEEQSVAVPMPPILRALYACYFLLMLHCRDRHKNNAIAHRTIGTIGNDIPAEQAKNAKGKRFAQMLQSCDCVRMTRCCLFAICGIRRKWQTYVSE